MRCFFATDLHGSVPRYQALWERIIEERPDAVLLGGDLLPMLARGLPGGHVDFVDYLAQGFERVREAHPELRVLLILGNDDPRTREAAFLERAAHGAWEYIHDRRISLGEFQVFGYAYVPPTPFRLKDWERYDVSRYVDPGCVSPEEGARTIPEAGWLTRISTIRSDLAQLTRHGDLSRAVMLFHSPPYDTHLDRADLDGQMIDHCPVDVHVGSIAIRRFIEARQPLLTLHGHVHEATRLTGEWRQTLGRTTAIQGAHDGEELALVRVDLRDPAAATRTLEPV